MKLDASLVGELDLEGALAGAMRRPGDFFPSRLGYAAAARAATFLPGLRAELKRDFSTHAAETVQVPKWSGGTRPAVDLAVADRILLDALVARLRPQIVDGLVGWSPRGQARMAAETGIVESGSVYVLMTDVAAFYEYVDHDLLADELMDLTGDEPAVSAVAEVLGGLMGRRGLPQGPLSVGDLADVYLSAVDRRMIRDGHPVFRFTDDYRIPVASWGAARSAQIRLERYLRDVGLVINVGKTFSPRHELYVAWESKGRPPWLDELLSPATVDPAPNPDVDPDAAQFADEYDQIDYEIPEGADRPAIAERIVEDLRTQISQAEFWGTPDYVLLSKGFRAELELFCSLRASVVL
jgi:RNA-directed DNA polymerase